MKDYLAKNIRNLSIIGHGSVGKTTLAEALLFSAGAIDRQGRVEDGQATMDYDSEEVKRHISLQASMAPLEWKNSKVNLVDIPGYFDFAGEQVGPLNVCEGALIVVGAVSGLDVGAEKAWSICDKTHTSRMIVITKMDQENANFDKVLNALTEKYGSHLAPIEVPIVEGGKFTGVACLLEKKAFMGEGKNLKAVDIPASVEAEVEKCHEALVEAAASADDDLMMKYLEGEELTEDEVMSEDPTIKVEKNVETAESVLSGLGEMSIDVVAAKLLDNVVDLMPSPEGTVTEGTNPKTGEAVQRACSDSEPFSAHVFKTMADPFVGKLSLMKVTSGVLEGSTALYNVNAEKTEKPGTIYFLKGKQQISAQKVHAGDLCALAKLTSVATGNTLCDANNPIRFPDLDFPAPCISKAVYAKKAGEEDKIFSGLRIPPSRSKRT